VKTGSELISQERSRQISKEGWSADHDDAHDQRELARSALSYLEHYVSRAWTFTNELQLPAITDGPKVYRSQEQPDSWPWEEKDWKPKDPISDLIKAGALIASEIDRLQRRPTEKSDVK